MLSSLSGVPPLLFFCFASIALLRSSDRFGDVPINLLLEFWRAMAKVNTGTVVRAAFAGCLAFATKFATFAKAGGGAAKGLGAILAAGGATAAGLYSTGPKK